MAELTIQQLDSLGITPSYAAASANGDSFVNTRGTFVHVKNGGGGSITVGVAVFAAKVTVPDAGEIATDPISIAIPAGQERVFQAPFGIYGGHPTITYTGVTSVTVGVFQTIRGL